jgi:hypothetical protein
MTCRFAVGDRVHPVHDPRVPGTVTHIGEPLHKSLPGAMVSVRWDDGYSFTYGERFLAHE